MAKFFSHSRLSSFEQCKLKYKFRYLDEIIPEVEKTIESHLGSVVHDTLEWLYNKVKSREIPTAEEIIMRYSITWKEDYHEDIPIIKKYLTVQDYFNKGVEFLLNYYMEHQPFNDNTLGVEEEIFLDLDENGEYKIRGFIDRLAFNLETEEYEIHDYKTSGNLPTDKDIEKDRQLALYAIGVKNKYGKDKKIKLIWHYLSFNKKLYSNRTDQQLDQLKKDTLKLVREIENTKDFPPTKSSLCDWCEYKSICPAWGKRPPGKQSNLNSFFKGSMEHEK